MRRLTPRNPDAGHARPTCTRDAAASGAAGSAAYEARHAAPLLGGSKRLVVRGRGPAGLAVAVAAAAVVTSMVVAPAGSMPSAATGHTAAGHHDGVRRQSGLSAETTRGTRVSDLVSPRTVPSSRQSTGHGSRHTTLDARSTREVASRNTTSDDTASVSPLAADGIPVTALEAYRNAAHDMTVADPNCQIPWPLIAGIGRVESDHGRFGGAVLRTDGTSSKKILGPVLDGHGTAVIRDTDGGALDGNSIYDRAMGPMQFIPSTWKEYASDGNGDGVDDPFNIYDAALATAKYLCAAGGNLSTTAGQERAVFSYNHLDSYVREVIGLERAYAAGAGVVVPDGPVDTAGLRGSKTSATGGGSSPVRAHAPRTPRDTTSTGPKTPRTAPVSKHPGTSPTTTTGGSGSGSTSHSGGTTGKPTPPSSTPPASTPPSTTPVSTAPSKTLTCPAGSHPAGTKPGAKAGTKPGVTPGSTSAKSSVATSSVAMATGSTDVTGTTVTGTTVTGTTVTGTPAKTPKLPAGCVADKPGTTGTLAG